MAACDPSLWLGRSYRPALSHGRLLHTTGSSKIKSTKLADGSHIGMLGLFGISATGHLEVTSLGLPSFAKLAHETGNEEHQLWLLASILFDDTQESTDPYSNEVTRMVALDRWLVDAVQASKDLPVTLHSFPILERLLLANDIEGAARLAASHGAPRLAVMISLARSDPILRQACFERQLMAWEPYSHRIPQEHWLVLCLLAGRLEPIMEQLKSGAPWILVFALHFWFALAGRPSERLNLALQSTCLDGVADVRLGLLRLFLQENYVIGGPTLTPEDILKPSGLSPTMTLADTTRIMWILSRKLNASSELLDGQFAEVLESLGRPDLALCLVHDFKQRLQLTTRNYAQLQTSPHINQTSAEMLVARAVWFKSENAPPPTQFEAFCEAGDWNEAASILARQMGPSLIIKDDPNVCAVLGKYLNKFPFEIIESAGHQKNPDLLTVAIVYGYASLRMAMSDRQCSDSSLHPAFQTVFDNIRSLPSGYLNANLPVRIMVSEVSRRLLQLSQQADLAVPFQSLPMSSDARLQKAVQLAVDLINQ